MDRFVREEQHSIHILHLSSIFYMAVTMLIFFFFIFIFLVHLVVILVLLILGVDLLKHGQSVTIHIVYELLLQAYCLTWNILSGPPISPVQLERRRRLRRLSTSSSSQPSRIAR